MQIAAEIRAELGRQRITYAALAEKLQTTRQNIWRILTDDSRPMKDQEIKAIADVLNLDAWLLMRRAEEAETKKAHRNDCN